MIYYKIYNIHRMCVNFMSSWAVGVEILRGYSTGRTCARDHLLPLKIKTTSVGHVAGAHTM